MAQNNYINKLVIVALIVSLGFNLYQWNDNSSMEETYAMRVDSLITDRVDVEEVLNDTYQELNQYKGINTRLDSLLAVANNELDDQRARINELLQKDKNQTHINYKLQAELDGLKKLRNDYLERIDQLLVENEQLKIERSNLETTVESLTKNLEVTVSTASVIRSEYFKVSAYRKRSNEKYLETAMARRTNKLEACFTLLENNLTKPGEKSLFLRIIEPGGKVVGNRSEGSSTFRKAGTEEDLLYTSSKQIDYRNEKSEQCIDWEEIENSFSSGTYLLEIYIDGALSGAGIITLR